MAVSHSHLIKPRVKFMTGAARTGEGLKDWYALFATRRLAAVKRSQ
jgi:hypothetical protein